MKYFSFKFIKEMLDQYNWKESILEHTFSQEEMSSWTEREKKFINFLLGSIYNFMILFSWIYFNIKQPK